MCKWQESCAMVSVTFFSFALLKRTSELSNRLTLMGNYKTQTSHSCTHFSVYHALKGLAVSNVNNATIHLHSVKDNSDFRTDRLHTMSSNCLHLEFIKHFKARTPSTPPGQHIQRKLLILTDKKPNEESCDGWKDEKCHNNTNHDASLALWWCLLFLG